LNAAFYLSRRDESNCMFSHQEKSKCTLAKTSYQVFICYFQSNLHTLNANSRTDHRTGLSLSSSKVF